jgi:hypothetical protein
MNPYNHLGLDIGATPKDIKRAYASMLKKCRPDTDAISFQMLNEAYQHALADSEYRIMQNELSGIADEETLTDLTDHPPLPINEGATFDESTLEGKDRNQQVSFNVLNFLDELYTYMENPNSKVKDWLNNNENLYSIELKDAIIPAMLDLMINEFEAPHPDSLEQVLAFFNLHNVGGKPHWIEQRIFHLRQRSQENSDDLARINYFEHRRAPLEDQKNYEILKSELSLLKRIWLWLTPGKPTKLFELSNRLIYLQRNRKKILQNSETLNYWTKNAGREKLTTDRAFFMLLRCAIAALAITPFVFNAANLLRGCALIFGTLSVSWLIYSLTYIGFVKYNTYFLNRPNIDKYNVAGGISSLTGLLLIPFDETLAISYWPILAGSLFILYMPKFSVRPAVFFASVLGLGALSVLSDTISTASYWTDRAVPTAWCIVNLSIITIDVIYQRIRKEPAFDLRCENIGTYCLIAFVSLVTVFVRLS